MEPSLNPLPPASPSRRGGIVIILIAVLGVGTALFGSLSIYAFGKAHTATTTLNAVKSAAASEASAKQKADDDKAAQQADESPYRSYVAPNAFGSFEVKFPKNWSATADEEESSNTQVTLVMNPDFVRKVNGTDALAAAKVLLVQQPLETYLRSYTSRKTVTRADITVSGIKGANLTGDFNDKRTTRIVAIPVRDKTLVFINEDSKYAQEFDAILAQSTIVP